MNGTVIAVLILLNNSALIEIGRKFKADIKVFNSFNFDIKKSNSSLLLQNSILTENKVEENSNISFAESQVAKEKGER